MHPLCGAQPVPFVSVRITRGTLVSHFILMSLLAAEPQSSAGLLCLTQYLIGMSFLTACPMVRDWSVLRAGSVCFPLYSVSLYFFYGLALQGWVLRTDIECIYSLYAS